MKFSLVTLYVKNMEKSLDFYHSLLRIPIVRRQPMGDGKELIFMGNESDVNLELIPSDSEMVYSGFSIGFEVENLAEVKESLATAGYPIAREIFPHPSTTLCFLEGPNEEEVELIEYK